MRILLLSICMIAFGAQAQVVYKNTEYGFGLGGSNYYGDINQIQQFDYARYSGMAFFKYNFNPYISLKAMASYGKIGGNDKFNKTTFEKSRNLSFENDIFELGALAEFNFLHYEPGDFDARSTPYILLGFGVFKHDPYTTYAGKKYFLKPLGTEGQNLPAFSNRKYSRINADFITGLGYKFWMKGAMTMGFEASYRFTATDYLDDVSTTYIGTNLFPIPNPSDPYQSPSRQLQDRSVEGGFKALGNLPGRQRGISSNYDQFLFAHIFVSFRLAEYACPK